MCWLNGYFICRLPLLLLEARGSSSSGAMKSEKLGMGWILVLHAGTQYMGMQPFRTLNINY